MASNRGVSMAPSIPSSRTNTIITGLTRQMYIPPRRRSSAKSRSIPYGNPNNIPDTFGPPYFGLNSRDPKLVARDVGIVWPGEMGEPVSHTGQSEQGGQEDQGEGWGTQSDLNRQSYGTENGEAENSEFNESYQAERESQDDQTVEVTWHKETGQATMDGEDEEEEDGTTQIPCP